MNPHTFFGIYIITLGFISLVLSIFGYICRDTILNHEITIHSIVTKLTVIPRVVYFIFYLIYGYIVKIIKDIVEIIKISYNNLKINILTNYYSLRRKVLKHLRSWKNSILNAINFVFKKLPKRINKKLHLRYYKLKCSIGYRFSIIMMYFVDKQQKNIDKMRELQSEANNLRIPIFTLKSHNLLKYENILQKDYMEIISKIRKLLSKNERLKIFSDYFMKISLKLRKLKNNEKWL